MDTEKCHALLETLRIGNLTRAAQELGYTASGISRMMASLEQEAGFPLLLRSRSGVRPTEECRRLLPVIRELDRLGDQYDQETAKIRGLDIGSLNAGTAYINYYGPLSRIIAEFSRRYPGIRVGLIEGRSSELAGMVSDHEADFCIITKRDGRFDWIPLLEDEMTVWVPRDHPRADQETYPLTDFEKDPFIEIYPNQITDNSIIFERLHITPNTRYSVVATFAAMKMIEAGLGVTMVNSLYVKERTSPLIRSLKPDPPIKVGVGIAVTKENELSPAARTFREFAVEKLVHQEIPD